MNTSLPLIQLTAFISVFLIVFVLEYYFPLREILKDTKTRWFHNFGLTFINTLLIRSVSFLTPLWVAFYLEQQWFGLFNIVQIPYFIEFIVTIFVLDFLIYAHHIAFHKFPILWRLHEIHHADEDLDVTSWFRFHFWEALISLVYKLIIISVFWVSAIAILVFEILLSGWAMFNHANLYIPKKYETRISKVIVTPKMHQVHHSVQHKQTDSNYGFFFSFWDRLCKTYTPHQFFVEKLGLNYTKKNMSFLNLLLLNIKWK